MQNFLWSFHFQMACPLPIHPIFIESNAYSGKKEWQTNLRSNDALIIRGRRGPKLYVASNQRLAGIVVIGCQDCLIMILDSVVISSRTLRLVDCENCPIFKEDVGIRRTELFCCRSCSVTMVGDDVLLSVQYVITCCTGIEIELRKFSERRIRSQFCDNSSMCVSEVGMRSIEKSSTPSNLTKVSEKVRDGLSTDLRDG
jgi:hypothetical protein